MKNLVFKSAYFFLFVCVQMVSAQNKGEGGTGGELGHDIITPYRDSIKIDIEHIMTVKMTTMKSRIIRDFRNKRIGILNNIGFAFICDDKEKIDPFYDLTGSLENNETFSTDLSIVEYMKILKHEKGRSLIEIGIFPDIEASELLRLKPNYSQLRSQYSRKLNLWVNHQNELGCEFALISSQYSWYSWDEDRINININHTIIAKISDISKNTEIEFGYGSYYYETTSKDSKPNIFEVNRQPIKFMAGGRQIENPIWWAIPSVSGSPGYPFWKRVTANMPFFDLSNFFMKER